MGTPKLLNSSSGTGSGGGIGAGATASLWAVLVGSGGPIDPTKTRHTARVFVTHRWEVVIQWSV